jgi:hypothetical protein
MAKKKLTQAGAPVFYLGCITFPSDLLDGFAGAFDGLYPLKHRCLYHPTQTADNFYSCEHA